MVSPKNQNMFQSVVILRNRATLFARVIYCVSVRKWIDFIYDWFVPCICFVSFIEKEGLHCAG